MRTFSSDFSFDNTEKSYFLKIKFSDPQGPTYRGMTDAGPGNPFRKLKVIVQMVLAFRKGAEKISGAVFQFNARKICRF